MSRSVIDIGAFSMREERQARKGVVRTGSNLIAKTGTRAYVLMERLSHGRISDIPAEPHGLEVLSQRHYDGWHENGICGRQ